MRLAKISLALCLGLGLSAPAVYAGTVSQTAVQAQVQTDSMVSQTETEITKVISGLRNYYTNTLGWPSDISSISTYYSGSFSTPVGDISGSPTTTRYQLVIDLIVDDSGAIAQLKSLASKLNGVVDETKRQMYIPVDTPQEAAIVGAMLSRLPDTSGSGLNTMQVDLNMGGFSINDADIVNSNTVNASIVNGTTVNSTDINTVNIVGTTATISTVNATLVDTPTIQSATGIINLASNTTFSGTATFNDASVFNNSATFNGISTFNDPTTFTSSITQASGQSAKLGNVTADSANITGTLVAQGQFTAVDAAYFANGIFTGSGTVIADNAGRLFYQGQDLETRYLGINDTAVDSDSLGGLLAENYARNNIDNNFSAHQTFTTFSASGDATVSGTLTVGALTTNGNIVADNFYVGSRSIWASTMVDRINSNTSRISTLESKVNAGSTSNATGRWVHTSTGKWTYGCSDFCPGTNPAKQAVSGRIQLFSTYAAGGSCLKGSLGFYGPYDAGEGNTNKKFNFYTCS